MFETILACSILLDVEMMSDAEYREHLDELFIANPENDFLLDLEWCFSDVQKAISLIREYFYDKKVDYNVLGIFLMEKLEKVYLHGEMDFKLFASQIYKIWTLLPNEVHEVQPFWTMSYADDPLSWGDEKQSRELYEDMFTFYRK